MNINTFDITLEAEYEGPGRDDNDWLHDAWDVTLTRGRVVISIPYKMGTGLDQREPTLHDVLSSLQSDARVHEWDEYDDVLGDMPYSKAKVVAQAIERQTNLTRALLGDDYDNFLNEECDL